jgi:hypothetical protein
MIFRFQLKDVVNISTLKRILERSNKVTNIWKIQLNKLALDLFQLFPLQKLKATIVTIIEQMFVLVQGNCECFCIGCLVYLLLNQHFCLFHNLPTFTIYKVEMHTKVNHCSWNGLKSMDNIINLCNHQHTMEAN